MALLDKRHPSVENTQQMDESAHAFMWHFICCLKKNLHVVSLTNPNPFFYLVGCIERHEMV